jgi:hypothetical protein
MDLTKLSHSAWTAVILPLVLGIVSTLTPGTIRLSLLVAAVVAATWTFHLTNYAGKQIKKTALAAVGFLIVASIVFFICRATDAPAKTTQVAVTPVVVPITPPSRSPSQPTPHEATGEPVVQVARHVPTAQEIATAVAEETRVRDLFSREVDKPIISMYVILSLSNHLTPDAVSGIAGAFEIFDGRDENKPGLHFGFRPGAQESTEIPGNKKTTLNGIRSEVWTFPRTSDANTMASILDNFLVCRFDYLDRLEAGVASMKLPFQTVGELDRAVMLFKSSRQLIDYFSRIRIVVNDFVISELDRKDIINWSAPPPVMIGRVTRGEIDPNTGQIKNQEIVKETPISLKHEMPDGFRDFPYFMALFTPDRAQKPAPMNNTIAINLAQTKIEIHRVTNGRLPSLEGSMWILPGQHGWLPQ